MTLLVIGNAALDRSYRVDRLPHEGESVLAEAAAVEPGGKGLNQAVMAARTGAEVRFLTMLGHDEAGRKLRLHLDSEGLGGPLVLEHAGPSDESLILVGPSGENQIVTTNAAAGALPAAAVQAAIATLETGDLLLMQGNLDERTTRDGLAAAHARGLGTLFNPSPLRAGAAGALHHVRLLIVNAPEAARLGEPRVPILVTTLGAAGARLTTATGSQLVAAPRTTALDTTGAGDVLAGVLAGCLSQGAPLEQALDLAVRAASLKVARRGTAVALPSAAELRALGSSGPAG